MNQFLGDQPVCHFSPGGGTQIQRLAIQKLGYPQVTFKVAGFHDTLPDDDGNPIHDNCPAEQDSEEGERLNANSSERLTYREKELKMADSLSSALAE